MSYYYNYYLGYKDGDGMFHPLGPFDDKGKIHEVFYRSRSFASDLHERFWELPDEKIADDLRDQFEYDDWDGKPTCNLKWLPLEDLPKDSFIRSGYFLINDIKSYQSEEDSWDLFYDWMTPTEFAMRADAEARFGPPQPKKDEEGGEYTEHSCRDYAYFSYPDYQSEEYESFMIRLAATSYEYAKHLEGCEIVALETEG